MNEKKVIHEIKLDKSIKAILWGFVLAIMFNAVPKGMLVEDALAELDSWDTLEIQHKGYINISD